MEAACVNADANGVAIELTRVNLREQPPPPAPTVSANLTAPLLLELARAIEAGDVQRPRTLVLSGVLVVEVERVAGAFAAAGLRVEAERPIGEWVALLLRG